MPVCSSDPDGDGTCDDDEVDAYDVILIYDEASKRGVVVVTPVSPEFTPATFTGMLRRDERACRADAIDAEELEFDDLEHRPSATTTSSMTARRRRARRSPSGWPLCAASRPGSSSIGLAGGYLIYRRGERPMPAPATTMAIGDRIPLRVTGILRAASDVVHVREVPADLLRYQTSEAAPVAAVGRA